VRLGLSDGVKVEVLSGIDKAAVLKRPKREAGPPGKS
jgi:hypothetical protein